jgi:dihydrofolate reductase
MRSVTYSMSVSLDGYIVGPDGDFDWTAPDEAVFRFVTDEIREVGVHLLGRRLYETMRTGRPPTRIHRSTTQCSSGPRSGSRSQRWCSPPR